MFFTKSSFNPILTAVLSWSESFSSQTDFTIDFEIKILVIFNTLSLLISPNKLILLVVLYAQSPITDGFLQKCGEMASVRIMKGQSPKDEGFSGTA